NQFCEMKGILRQFSIARTPQQNGVAKRRNKTLIEADRTMLVDSNKAFRVFNSRTRIVEKNLHIRFSESTPNVVGSGPDWLFNIDALTRTINYEPIIAGTQSNSFAGTKASDNVGQARKEPEYVDEDPRKENECKDQQKNDNVNNANNVNIVNAGGTNEDNELPFDLNMLALEGVSIFNLSRDDEDDDAVADMNNLDTTIQVSSIPTTKIHKDHPLDQLIGDLQSATQTRKNSKNLEERREIMIRNKARLVAQGYTQEKGIDYNEVFALVARIEAIRLFLAYASFKDFVMYQMDIKSAFLYGKIEEEGYVCQPPGFEDPDFLDRVYKVEKALYRLHQASRAWSMIGSLMYLTSSRPDIMFAVYACAIYQVNPKVSYLYVVKKIFRYLKGQPKLGPWYPKDFSFDLVAYTDSDYAGASLDRKSTTGGCQFLGCRLKSWQCKK
nr:ribonuclease H-like domain-containing protein [Tanacetum cinerariifolium]